MSISPEEIQSQKNKETDRNAVNVVKEPVIEKPIIVIEVSAYWEKRDKSWDENKVTDREYTTPYHGGWEITKCKGFPSINGGYGSPDFDYTPDQIKQRFINEYSSWYDGKYHIIVKLKITKDERNPTMENFF